MGYIVALISIAFQIILARNYLKFSADSPYLAVITTFYYYNLFFLQLIPLMLNYDEFISINQLYLAHAFIFNLIYNSVCIIVVAKFERKTNPTNTVKLRKSASQNYQMALLLMSMIINVLPLMLYIDQEFSIEKFLFPFYQFFSNAAKIIPFLILLFHQTREVKKIKYTAIAGVVIYFISILPTGHRGSLIMPILLLVVMIKVSVAKKIMYGLIFSIIFIPLSDFYKSFRILLSPIESVKEQTYYESNFIDEIKFRLGENIRISVGISKIINEYEIAGTRPILSSIKSIIPKSDSQNEKDWPGSVDGTEFGILANIAQQEVHGAGWNMSEYMYPLHPIWELGYVYYIVNILFFILYSLAINKISILLNDVYRLISISALLPFTYSHTFMALVHLIQSIVYVVGPGCLIFLAIALFKGKWIFGK